MAVLEKATLIGYNKLYQMIETNSIDEEAAYLLSGKDVVNVIKNILTSIEGLERKADIDNKLKKYIQVDKIVATDTTKAPDFTGQVAVVGSSIYIAESTEGPGAWRVVLLQPNDHL